MKSKRVSVLFFCVLPMLAALLSGCGENASSGNGSAASVASFDAVSLTSRGEQIKNADHSKSEALYAPVKGSTVKVAMFTEVDEGYLKRKAEFEKKYECTLVYENYDWRDWDSTLARLVASGSTPDTTNVSDNNFITYVSQNLIVPIDQYIDIEDTVWSKTVMDTYKWKNQYYAGADDFDPIVIIYNKTMFENAGQKEPIQYYNEGTWNFENLVKVAKAMTKAGSNGQTEVYGYWSGIREVGVLANGGSFVKPTNDGNLQITAGNANELAGMQLIQDLMNNGSYAWAVPGDGQNFIKSRIAMVADRSWTVLDSLRVSETMKDEVALAPFPKGPDVDKETTPAVCSGTGILSSAKNPLGAAAWIYFSGYYHQVNKNEPEILTTRRRWLSAENEAFLEGWMPTVNVQTTFCAGLGEWWTKTMPFWEDIMYNSVSPSSAVATHKSEMQYEIDQALKKK